MEIGLFATTPSLARTADAGAIENAQTGSKNITTSQDEAFRLLDLPPEIWLSICRYAVVKGVITVHRPDSRTLTAEDVAQPALSRTCPVLRVETLKTFYSEQEFRLLDGDHFSSTAGLRAWAAAIWSTWWPLITTLTIQSDSWDIVEWVEYQMQAEFDEEAPEEGEVKVLKFRITGLIEWDDECDG